MRKECISKSLPVLRTYLTLIKRKINTYQGIFEISDNKDSSFSTTVTKKLSDLKGCEIDLIEQKNEPLIAGFKLRIGDDVYEDSLSSRISRLKKSLT